jgi:hypothetical protein
VNNYPYANSYAEEAEGAHDIEIKATIAIKAYTSPEKTVLTSSVRGGSAIEPSTVTTEIRISYNACYHYNQAYGDRQQTFYAHKMLRCHMFRPMK